jgi:hypothetical protein
MFDENSTRALLGPADPARDVAVPQPRTTAAGVIAIAEATPRNPARAGRRLVLAAAALAVAAGATAGAYSLTRHDPAPPGQAADPTVATSQATELNLGPVVRPAAMQYAKNPPAAGDRLRALADGISAAPYESASGRYTYIHTVGWNAVFDDAPGGTAQVIRPQDKQLWYAADASGRIRTTPLPAVYPNEQSRQYWQQHTAAPTPGATRTAGPRVDDLPAGMAGPTKPLPTDPARLAPMLDVDTVAQHGTQGVFLAVRNLCSFYAMPQQTRAQVLRILADQPGISWRGTVTDRAGRAGVAISVDGATTQEILIFDPHTGTLLAWDEVERPTDTVAGATLILGYDRTDQLG